MNEDKILVEKMHNRISEFGFAISNYQPYVFETGKLTYLETLDSCINGLLKMADYLKMISQELVNFEKDMSELFKSYSENITEELETAKRKFDEFITEMNKKVDDKLEGINTTVSNLVDENMQKYIEDGTIADLINEGILGEFITKLDLLEQIVNTLDTRVHIYREIPLNATISEIQAIFDLPNPKIITFSENGEYNLSQPISINKDTTINLNNATLTFTNTTSFRNFKITDEFIQYNGNGNITIKNGSIIGGSIAFIHATDISFKSITFKEINMDHVMELCALNGVLIEDCNFYGVANQADSRNYVECINLDNCTYLAFPSFNENSITYDGTLCNNIKIKRCNFRNSLVDGYTQYSAIGNHSYVENALHNNLEISDCGFYNFKNHAIQLQNVRNILIERNNFENGTTTEQVSSSGGINILMPTYSAYNKVIIRDNYFQRLSRSIHAQNIQKLLVANNHFDKFNTISAIGTILTCEDVRYSRIINNHFEYFTKQCINNYTIQSYICKSIIDNNLFEQRYDATTKFNNCNYSGNIDVYNSNNIFNLSNGGNTGYNLTFNPKNGNLPTIGHIKNNQYSYEFPLYIDSQLTGQINNISNLKIKTWYGSTSNIVNQLLYYNNETNKLIKYSDYNTMYINFGVDGQRQQLRITPYQMSRKLTADVYYIPLLSSSGIIETATLTLSNDNQFTYVSSTVPIRSIYLINE